MKITLASHGGQAAATHLSMPARVIRTDTLPDEEARELTRLVARAMKEAPTADHSGGRARDAMSYTITVEDEAHSTVLSRSDTAMTAGFAALLAWLEEYFATH